MMTTTTIVDTAMRKLPATFQGLKVLRGKGTHYKTVDKLMEQKAWGYDEWPRAQDEFFLVVENNKDDQEIRGGAVFSTLKDALKLARANANGNVDQRVIRCTSEYLIIATENEL